MAWVTDKQAGIILDTGSGAYCRFKWWGRRGDVTCILYMADREDEMRFRGVMAAHICDYMRMERGESVSHWGIY